METLVNDCNSNLYHITIVVTGPKTVSRELSLHPIHLKPDINQNFPPSALVPFCSYQGDHNLLGEERLELQNLTLCDKFKPTILEGQLCYSLDMAKLGRKPTKQGQKNGLFLLVDPNPYPIKSTGGSSKAARNDQGSFKVYIHTLAEHTAFGPGAYAIHSLKKMTGKPNFYQMDDSQKECQAHSHSREKCQTEKFLSQVKGSCNCVPWDLTTTNSNIEVISKVLQSISS